MTINLTSSSKVIKYFDRKTGGISNVHIDRESRLYITLGTRGRGGRGLGRFLEVIEAFVDEDNRIFVGYKTRDGRSGLFRQYAVVGRLLPSSEEEAA